MLSMLTFLLKPPLMSELLMEEVPLSSANLMLPSVKGPPWLVPLTPSTTLFASVKPLTKVPLMPYFAWSSMRIRVRATLAVLFNTIPVPAGVTPPSSPPVVFWMRPPVHVGVAAVQVPPLPATVKPAARRCC